MVRSIKLNFKVSPLEKEILLALAEKHNVKPSELLRDLLRTAGRQAGLLPELTIEQQPDTEPIAA